MTRLQEVAVFVVCCCCQASSIIAPKGFSSRFGANLFVAPPPVLSLETDPNFQQNGVEIGNP
jgi:hypothetical protein